MVIMGIHSHKKKTSLWLELHFVFHPWGEQKTPWMSYRSRLVILKISPLDDTRVTKDRLIVSGNGSESCFLQRIQFRDVYQVKRFLNKLSENVRDASFTNNGVVDIHRCKQCQKLRTSVKISRICVLDTLRIQFLPLCNSKHCDVLLVWFLRNDTIKTTLITTKWGMTNWNLGTEIQQNSQFEDAFLRKKLKPP